MIVPDPARPGATPPEPVVLTSTVSAGSIQKLMIPMAVVLFAVTWLLASLILDAIGVPVPMLVAIPVAAAFTFAMWKVKGTQLTAQEEKTTLSIGPAGLRREDPYVIVEMPWQGVTGVERQQTLAKTATLHVGLKEASNVAAESVGNAASRHEVGLVGAGTIHAKTDLNALRAQQVKENYGMAAGESKATDRAMIVPGHFEAEWRTGAIGRALAFYRPDLRIPAADEDVRNA